MPLLNQYLYRDLNSFEFEANDQTRRSKHTLIIFPSNQWILQITRQTHYAEDDSSGVHLKTALWWVRTPRRQSLQLKSPVIEVRTRLKTSKLIMIVNCQQISTATISYLLAANTCNPYRNTPYICEQTRKRGAGPSGVIGSCSGCASGLIFIQMRPGRAYRAAGPSGAWAATFRHCSSVLAPRPLSRIIDLDFSDSSLRVPCHESASMTDTARSELRGQKKEAASWSESRYRGGGFCPQPLENLRLESGSEGVVGTSIG